MNKQVWKAISRHDPLTEEEISGKPSELLDAPYNELEESYKRLVEFVHNINRYEGVTVIGETIKPMGVAILKFDKSDVRKPGLTDEELLVDMASQADYVGEVARIVTHDDSLCMHSGAGSEIHGGSVTLGITVE